MLSPETTEGQGHVCWVESPLNLQSPDSMGAMPSQSPLSVGVGSPAELGLALRDWLWSLGEDSGKSCLTSQKREPRLQWWAGLCAHLWVPHWEGAGRSLI